MAVGGAGFLVTNMQLRWDIKRSSSVQKNSKSRQKIKLWRQNDVITFIFSNLFPKFRAFIITFQNGLYGTSSVVFLTFKVGFISRVTAARDDPSYICLMQHPYKHVIILVLLKFQVLEF